MHSDQVGEASSNGTLTGEGALLASLNAKRTGKMTDIVATIQGEQDRIIRADLNQAVVVQGGPGTGKTAVALHRAAYLLYTHRRALQRSGVLVVGPSSTFLHYIDQVLPSLGETGVVSRTIADLIPGIIATAHDDPYAAKLKGERRMAKAIANAVAARERVPSHLPVIRINGFNVPMVRADIEQAIADAKRTRQPHNKARETFVRDMLSAMRNRYVERLDYEPEQAELNDVMQQLRMNDDLRKTLNLAWLPMTGEWLVDQLFAKPQQLRRFAPWLEERDIETLTRPKGSPFTVSDVPLLDEAMELLGPDPKAVARQKALDAKRDGLAHADPSLSVALVHDCGRRGADLRVGRYPVLASHDGPAVRRTQLAAQRVDDQLPQSEGGVAARQRFRLVRRPVHLHGERRAWRPGFSQASHLA